MNNFHFDITGYKRQVFDRAMKIAFTHHILTAAYSLDSKKMTLYWTFPEDKDKDVIILPYAMDVNHAIDFVWSWLLENAGYSPGPSAEAKKGFRIYCETFGCIDKNPKTFVAIQPVWVILFREL